MTLKGIDISSAQRTMDVTQVDADFVIIKATQGTGYVNPYCDAHYQQAKKAGKLRGVYHYANGSNAIAEADFFLNNIQGYIKDALLALDWEKELGGGYKNPVFGTPGAPAWIKAWCNHVYQQTGVRPLVYLQASALADVNGIGDYGLWVAQYADGNLTGYQDHPWNEGAYSCAIRQYSSHGRVAGYGDNVDLDIAYMDAAAWHKYANPSGNYKPTETPKPAPTRKSNKEIADEVISGAWGNGDDRKNRLESAGYDYSTIQEIVNQKCNPPKKSNEEIADEVIAGAWGNGDDRKNRLAQAGYDYNAIQDIVNKKAAPARKSDDEIANEVISGQWGDGNDRKNRLIAAGYDYNAIQNIVNQKLGGGASQAVYYPVQEGDTLSEIAAAYGTTVQNIVNLNGISNPDFIMVGQRLRVK